MKLRWLLLGSLLVAGTALAARAQEQAPPPDAAEVSAQAPAETPAQATEEVAEEAVRNVDDGSGASAMSMLGTRAYLSPMFSYAFADSSRLTDDGYGGTLSLGKKLTNGLALELTGFYNRFSHDEPGDNDGAQAWGAGAAALVSPLRSFPDLYGVLAVHYGETSNLPGVVPDFESTVFDAGLGYLLQVTDAGSALRLEARYRLDSHDEEGAGEGGDPDFHDAVINIGLLMPLGGGAPVVESNVQDVAVVPVSSGDGDGDGVPDAGDQCPGTPAGAIVDDKGCENDAELGIVE